jgi:outer membrane protein OmpA-like peptidoglycan-associated protein
VDNAELVSAHLDVLEQVRRHLEAHPAVRLLIEGHSDPRGVDGGNMVLSMMRATRVRSWLVEHGVESGRLRALGCGARHPLERAQTPAAMRANRRVELRVLVPPSEVEPHPREGCIDAPPRLGERAGVR